MKDRQKKKFRRRQQPPAGYFTVQQAADYLGICEKSIRRYIKFYGLPAAKPAGRYLINKVDLERWIKENS